MVRENNHIRICVERNVVHLDNESTALPEKQRMAGGASMVQACTCAVR